MLRREGRFQTRLFLHFSGGAISAASQIQLSARASPSYKRIKDLVRKEMHISLLPHFVFIDSVYSALSTSSLLIFRQTLRENTFKLNDTEKKTHNVVEVVAAIVKKNSFAVSFLRWWWEPLKFCQNFLRACCSEKRARAQIPKPGDGFCVVFACP